MSTCCPVCYRVGVGVVGVVVEEEGCGWRDAEKSMRNNWKKTELQQRFFRLLQRYLSEEDDAKYEGGHGVKKSKLRFPLDQLAGIGMLPCEQCSKLMDSFSELYHQLKSTELLLNWRLETLHNIMRCAQRVPSRMDHFRTFMSKMELEEDSRRASVEESMESVINARKYIIVKCSRKISTTFPKLLTTKWKSPEELGVANGIHSSQSSGENENYEGSCSEHEPAENNSTDIQENVAPDGGIIDAGRTDFGKTNFEREEDTNETSSVVSLLSRDDDDVNLSKDTIESPGPSSLTGRIDGGNDLHNSTMVSGEDEDSTNDDDGQPMSEHHCLTETETEVQETAQFSSILKSLLSCDKNIYMDGKLSIHPEGFEIDRGNLNNIDGAEKEPSTDPDVVSPSEPNETCHKSNPNGEVEGEGREKEIDTEETIWKPPPGDEELQSDSQGVEVEPDPAPTELESSVSNFIKSPEVAVSRLRPTYRCNYCKMTFSTSQRLELHVQVVHNDNDQDAVCRMSSDNNYGVFVDSDSDSDSDSMCLVSSSSDEDSSSSFRQLPSRSDLNSTSNKNKIVKAVHSDDDSISFTSSSNDNVENPVSGDHHSVSDIKVPSLQEPVHYNDYYSWYEILKMDMQRNPYYRLKCPDCSGLFRSVQELLIHRKNTNPCAASYDPATYVKIELLVPPGGEKKCGPKLNFETVHAIIDLPQAIFICEIGNCGAVLYSLEDLEAHKKLHGSFSCQFCEVKVTFAPYLAEHEFTKHSKRGSSRKSHCPRCDFKVDKFHTISYVHHHLGSHLSLSLNEPICAICKTHICSLTRLRNRHVDHFKSMHDVSKVRNGTGILRCPIGDCRAYFLHRSQLRSHLRVRHTTRLKPICLERHTTHKAPALPVEVELPVSKSSYKCKDCGKIYADRVSFRRHRLREHVDPDKVIPCAKCSKVFETVDHMQKHQVVHSSNYKKPPGMIPTVGMMTFFCEHCGKAFKRKGRLQKHYLCHSGPDSWEFQCDVCSKKCASKQKLDEHKRTHTKEKPFVCQICGVQYSHRHNLRIHVNNKHGEEMEDKPRKFDKTNLTSRKGVKRKRRSNAESNDDTGTDLHTEEQSLQT